jgi:hypothetical protein
MFILVPTVEITIYYDAETTKKSLSFILLRIYITNASELYRPSDRRLLAK